MIIHLEKSDFVMLESDYVIKENTKRGSLMKLDSKRRYNHVKFTKLNNLFENIDRELEIPYQSIDHCCGKFCEIYKEGVRTWVPMDAIRGERSNKREMWFNKTCQKAKDLRDVPWRRYR